MGSASLKRLCIPALTFALIGCGGRPTLIASDGGLPDAWPGRDSTLALDGYRLPDRGPLKTDQCVMPSGYCETDKDCAKGSTCLRGYACKGEAVYRCGCPQLEFCHYCSGVIGKCVPEVCANDKDCPADQYCQHDGLCVVTGGIGGKCTPRASMPCTTDEVPVCGCDGMTYSSACLAHNAGVSVATKSPCLATTCDGLDAAYRAEVKKAKSCCVACASPTPQCQNRVADRLLCPCETFINAAESATMKALRAEWVARGCWTNVSCPPGFCNNPVGAQCMARGSVGLCGDLFGG